MERVFREAIREERRKTRLSQEVIAKRAGMKRSQLGAIERGERSLSEEEFVKICIALKVNLAPLLTRIYRSLSISLHGLEEELRFQMGEKAPVGKSEPMQEDIADGLSEPLKQIALWLIKVLAARSPGDFPLSRIPEEDPSRTRPRSRRSKAGSGDR